MEMLTYSSVSENIYNHKKNPNMIAYLLHPGKRSYGNTIVVDH